MAHGFQALMDTEERDPKALCYLTGQFDWEM